MQNFINLIPTYLIFFFGGVISGVLAGLLGIGGGVLLVSMLRSFGFSYPQAIATSSLAIVMTSTSGSFQNWRMGYLKFNRVILLGLPAIFTTLIGTYLVTKAPEYILQFAFGCLLFINIFLTNLRRKLSRSQSEDQIEPKKPKINSFLAIGITGAAAGFLAGLFGVGGGVILVPLQMLFLKEKIKKAIQTSLGVIVLTSIFACIGHYQSDNILFIKGIILGIGGLIGAQFSTRFLPKLPEEYVAFSFNLLLVILGFYSFQLAWQSFLKLN